MPVLSTLGMLHTAGIVHRGISPVTLHIGRDGKMRIGGFSISQARTSRSELTAQLFPGYAAVEQYGFEGEQGAWTDIYSFAKRFKKRYHVSPTQYRKNFFKQEIPSKK